MASLQPSEAICRYMYTELLHGIQYLRKDGNGEHSKGPLER